MKTHPNDGTEDSRLLRHARHLLLAQWGFEAQDRVERAHALIIGVGGLGSAAALYLAACGVGTLTLVDPDTVDLSNLHRQVIHTMGSLGESKVESAARAIQERNPEVQVRGLCLHAQEPALSDWVGAADVVLDCSDNFPTRQAINAACMHHGKPLVCGAALGWDAQIAVFPGQGPCYACLYPPERSPPEQACATLGVFAPLVGIIGGLQAAEALKLLGQGRSALESTLLLLEGRSMEWTPMRLKRRADCPVCGIAKPPQRQAIDSGAV